THDDANGDPDYDGLHNIDEYHAGTDPQNPDTDYDGVCDGAEVFDSTSPTNSDDVAHILLGSWRFDVTNWLGLQLQSPIASTNLSLVPGLSLNAVSINSANPAKLAYRDAEIGGCYANIVCRKGSLKFWFKGAWNSSTTNS